MDGWIETHGQRPDLSPKAAVFVWWRGYQKPVEVEIHASSLDAAHAWRDIRSYRLASPPAEVWRSCNTPPKDEREYKARDLRAGCRDLQWKIRVVEGDLQIAFVNEAFWMHCHINHEALEWLAQPEAAEPFSFHAHILRAMEFSQRTFGPGHRSKGVVDHIRKELLEIEAAPLDLEEWIDVWMLALDGAWRSGATPEQIIAQIQAKQTKNEGRKWPDWRTADRDKGIEHDRSAGAAPVAAQPTEPSIETIIDECARRGADAADNGADSRAIANFIKAYKNNFRAAPVAAQPTEPVPVDHRTAWQLGETGNSDWSR